MEEDYIDSEQDYEGRQLLQHWRRGLSGGLSFRERYLNTCEKRCGATSCKRTCIQYKMYKKGPGKHGSHSASSVELMMEIV